METMILIFLIQLIILAACLLTSNIKKIKDDFMIGLSFIPKVVFLLANREKNEKKYFDLKKDKTNLKNYAEVNFSHVEQNEKKKNEKLEVDIDLTKKFVDSFKINSVKTRKTNPFRSLLKIKLIFFIFFSISINVFKVLKLLLSGELMQFVEKEANFSTQFENRFIIKNKNYDLQTKVMKKSKKNYILELRAIKQSKLKIQKKIDRIEKLISKKRKFAFLPPIIETPSRV
jgi:hypothetical protein